MAAGDERVGREAHAPGAETRVFPARERAYKRPFDLLVLSVAHVVLSPLWLLLWIAIPLAIWLNDRGPVFYRQKRLGKGGRVFSVIKFRTMVVDAEQATGAVWASRDDPRLTRVGRLLRRTALDELPQVVNMWRGEMSLVGPRSERPELHAEFARKVPGFDRRLAVRPGLTGLAQINGGYDLPPAKKLEHDIDYIQRMSPLLDAWILARSVANTVLIRWDRRTDR